MSVSMGRFLSVVAAIRPVSEYAPGSRAEYSPPFPTAPYATPLVDSVPVAEEMAVIFVSLA
ncbi:MAG: hypothetical protein DMD74_04610 [Gemmatimonadetes bacterium]|nr:MAG: hypothetical protein DMD74_04610 [Gemmatimonadota bacterium]